MVRTALATLVALASAESEIAIPVVLWDAQGKPSASTGRPPRFVIGQATIGGRSQSFTFDAGNPQQPILLAEGCKGCSTGCPSEVPQCSGGSACWSSHPDEFAPKAAYVASGGCPAGVKSAGTLDGVAVCTQCFGGSSHSRFYTMAEANVTFAGQAGDVTVNKLRFGALVRTAPLTDRVWSNVGVGYRSAFLQQLGASSVLFHLRPGGGSQVIFNPSQDRYRDAPSASFAVEGNRVHSVTKIEVKGTRIDTSGLTFHIDTGNEGISIADSSVLSKLQSAAQGLTPTTAPDLVLYLEGMAVTLPGQTWVTGSGKTVFSSYSKNVLGLPFLSAADIVFDDAQRRIYIAGGSPSPSPTPSPTPSPSHSGCVDQCQSSSFASSCDCACFCSCSAICGNGCYDGCRSFSGSCKSGCPWSAWNQTLVV